jgi:hypothetical protein
MEPHPGRLHLEHIASTLETVEMQWTEIDDELDRRGLGRKDTPFDAVVRMRMMSAIHSYILRETIGPVRSLRIGSLSITAFLLSSYLLTMRLPISLLQRRSKTLRISQPGAARSNSQSIGNPFSLFGKSTSTRAI